jgi:hypothetical protein
MSPDPLQLKTVDSKSLIVLSRLFPAHLNITIQALIDSGCSARAFCDRAFVQQNGITTTPTPYIRTLLLADGKEAESKIDQYFIAPIAIGNHEELCLFFVTDLSPDTPIILGLPWLQRHNPAINWTDLSLSFTSLYCQHYCCPPWLDPKAPSRPIPKLGFHDLEIPGEPQLRRMTYQKPTVEDALDDSESGATRYIRPKKVQFKDVPEEIPTQVWTDDAKELPIQLTLSPGTHPFRTQATKTAGPESRALMIPTSPDTRSAPAPFIAGRRRCGKHIPKVRPLPSAPPPEDHSALPHDERPDLTDINMVDALQFARFSQVPGVKVFRMNWEEFDELSKPKSPQLTMPDVREDVVRNALLGQGSKTAAQASLPPEFHEFIEECYQPLRLARITEADINKFLKGKPDLSKDEVLHKLPPWLHDKVEGFLPKNADAMPPRRSWDHKIELMPGQEPPYQKSRPMSPAELKVVRKWLDDNLTKGFIRESRARCAAPLLLAAKPGGGVRICQDYRGLNNVTIKNRYPLPLIRETLDAICRAKVYTKLDIVAAFNKLRNLGDAIRLV